MHSARLLGGTELSTFAETFAKDIAAIAKSIRDNDVKGLEALVESVYGSNVTRKFILNILYIAAAVGTPDICQYLLRYGFTADSLSMHELILQVLPNKCEMTTPVSPLAISIQYCNIKNVQFLLKHTGNDVLEKCNTMPSEIETMFMEELCIRLSKIHHSLHPKVIAGYEDGMLVLVVYSEKPTRTSEMFCKRKVIFANPKIIKREYSLSSMFHRDTDKRISTEDMNIAQQIIKERGDSLWKAHSNLNIISISAKKYVKGKEEVVPVCISLYCTSKGIIPLGEPTFPALLGTADGKHELPVDVREGYFEYSPGYQTSASTTFHQKLKMGCLISRAINPINGGGTLGPFVDINGEMGFLTCAHVLFDISNGKIDYDDAAATAIGVTQPAIGALNYAGPGNNAMHCAAMTPCGHIRKAIFNPDLNYSLDVALVQITHQTRKPEQGQFAIASMFNYQDIGFDVPPLFNSGACKNPVEVSTISQVIKCGSATHLTRGFPVANGTQVRPLTTNLGLPNTQLFQMRNQIEIASLAGHRAFLQPGDSGSAVFTMNEDRSLKCIGMAIGFTSDYTAVVTPIAPILEALGPGVTLKSFEN